MKYITIDCGTEKKVPIFSPEMLDEFHKFKADLCEYQLAIITPEQGRFDTNHSKTGIEQIVFQLQNAWCITRQDNCVNLEDQQKAWEIIDGLTTTTKSVQFSSSPYLRKIKGFRSTYIVFLGKNSKSSPISEIVYLSCRWQLEKEKIPVHAAGVIHRKGLILFSGPSGAGKSTVSRISVEQGDQVLDEDQVLLIKKPDQTYHAQAWGYSLQKSELPISALFMLIQDQEDRIVPIEKSKSTQYLFERVLESFGFALENDLIENLFHQLAEFCRSVPCYELHFRNSPDFWKLIDSVLINEPG